MYITTVQELAAMKLTLFPSKITKPARNFWNNIHFHPTDAIEDEWGQRILNRVAADGAAKTVRMYAMLEDIVTENENGELRYDFTLNDIRLDYMLSKGFDIFLSYNFIPPCISSDTLEKSTVCKKKTRYKGKYILTSPPKSYEKWGEICKKYTEHIVERYGIDTVSRWQLQCYNEPDIGAFFMSGATVAERCAEYCKLYDSFARAVKSVSPELKIGGPALAGEYEFMQGFLDHVAEGNVPIDFICIHSYGTEPSYINDNTRPLCVTNHLEKIRDIIKMTADHGLGDLPLIIDEWGASTAGFMNTEDCPALIFRETPVFAAYFVKLFTLIDELELPVSKLIICLSGQHEMETDFSGFRNFFTLNFYPKPIYNAFCLASRLYENKIAFQTSEKCEGLSVYPTVSNDGKINLILAYASNYFDGAEPLDLTLSVKGRCFATVTRIDEDHANAINVYKSLGSPTSPTEAERAQITAAAQLSVEVKALQNGELRLTVLPNSVVSIEL